jgi:hypothetical protein
VNSAKNRMIPDHNDDDTIFQGEVKVTVETFTTLVHDGKE